MKKFFLAALAAGLLCGATACSNADNKADDKKADAPAAQKGRRSPRLPISATTIWIP